MLQNLAPNSLSEFIGQENLKQQVKICIIGARRRGETFPHSLLHGPPGFGKTSLAHIIIDKMKANNQITLIGGSLDGFDSLASIIKSINPYDVLFIDEVHRIKPKLQEALYPIFDSHVFYMKDEETDEIITHHMPPFTILAATTEVGTLSRPFRDRFRNIWAMTNYNAQEMEKIIEQNVRKLELESEKGVNKYIANRCKLTPRLANRLLFQIRDVLHSSEEFDDDMDIDEILENEANLPTFITKDIAKSSLDLSGIDDNGFDKDDRTILSVMKQSFDGKPVGIEVLGRTTNIDAQTIKTVHEPYLLQSGYVSIQAKGRGLTTRGTLAAIGIIAEEEAKVRELNEKEIEVMMKSMRRRRLKRRLKRKKKSKK